MIELDTVKRMRAGHLCAHYLLASYCYYHLDGSPMTDAAFDYLCKQLHAKYDAIKVHAIHPHISYIKKEDLLAGTCLLDARKYPSMVRASAEKYLERCTSGEILALLEPHLLPVQEETAAPARIRRTRSAPAPAAPVAAPPAARRISRRRA